MKAVILLFALIGAVLSRPQQSPRDAYITKYDNDNAGLDRYSFDVETSDGFKHEQRGELKNIGSENEVLAVTGSYSYVGPDGNTYRVDYTADENGFQPEGDHIPPSAGVRKRPKLGIPSAAISSLAGGGLG